MKLTTKIVDMLHEDFLILQHLITFDAQFKSAKTFTAWLTENNLKRAFEYAQAIADANWHTQVVMAHDVENLEARGYTDYAKVSQALMANIFTKHSDFINANFLLTAQHQLAIRETLTIDEVPTHGQTPKQKRNKDALVGPAFDWTLDAPAGELERVINISHGDCDPC